MIGWLAHTSSNDVGCNCRSPRDDWEMAGLLALAISKDFGCNFEALGDGWENTCCSRAPNTTKTISTTQQNHRVHTKNKTKGLGGRLLRFQNKSCVDLHRQEVAGRWLGDGWGNTSCIRTPDTNKNNNTTKHHTIQCLTVSSVFISHAGLCCRFLRFVHGLFF